MFRYFALGALLLIVIVVNYFIFTAASNLKSEDYKTELIPFAIAAKIESHGFLDDIYQQNSASLQLRLQSFLTSYQERFGVPICITLEALNFSKKRTIHITKCTDGVDNHSINTLKEWPDVFSGNKNFEISGVVQGNISWIYAKKSVPVGSAAIIVFTILEELLVFGIVFYIIRKGKKHYRKFRGGHENIDSEIKALKIEIESYKDKAAELEDLVSRIDVYNAVINKNKRLFPVTDDTVFVTYEHPYGLIHDSRGIQIKMNASLTIIKLIYGRRSKFINISRSCIVSALHLEKFKVNRDEDSGKLQLIMSINSKNVVQDIGKNFENEIFELVRGSQ